MPSSLPSLVRAPFHAALALGLVAGCERKAPGPAECEQHTLRIMGADDEQQIRNPVARKVYEEQLVKCLTTPYDRELLRCVEVRGPRSTCLAEFHLRKGQKGAARGPEPAR